MKGKDASVQETFQDRNINFAMINKVNDKKKKKKNRRIQQFRNLGKRQFRGSVIYYHKNWTSLVMRVPVLSVPVL